MSQHQISLDVRAVDPEQSGAHRKAQWLAVRCDGGPVHPVRLVWDDGWAADLEHLSHNREPAAVLARIGRRLRRALAATGWPKAAARIRAAYDSGETVTLSVTSDVPEVLRLPWEAVPVGDGGAPLATLLSAPVRYAEPGVAEPPSATDSGSGRFLLVATGSDRDRVAGLRTTSAGGRVSFLPGATLSNIEDALQQGVQRGRPVRVLQLVGRVEARPDGVRVRLGADGASAEWVAPTKLADALSRHGASLEAVVLTLFGEPCDRVVEVATALHRAGVPWVVGQRHSLSRDAVVLVADALRQALVEHGQGIQAAVHAAAGALDRAGRLADAASLLLLGTVSTRARPFAVAPYLGARPYGPADARRFAGRAAETKQLVGALSQLEREGRPRFVVVAGARGSGRSSLVLGGLFATLQRDNDAWSLAQLHPGVRPEAQLDAAVSGRGPDAGPLLVVVDPFDVLLASPDHAQAGHRLVNRLWQLAASGTSRVSVVLVVAVDQLSRCGALQLTDMGTSLERLAYDERHRVFVTEPGPRSLREIVSQPIADLGLAPVDADASVLVRSAARHNGSLRAFSTALSLAWRARRGGKLRLFDFDEDSLSDSVLEECAAVLRGALPDPVHHEVLAMVVRLLAGPDEAALPVELAAIRPGEPTSRARFDTVLQLLIDHGVVERRTILQGDWLILHLPELARRLKHRPPVSIPEPSHIAPAPAVVVEPEPEPEPEVESEPPPPPVASGSRAGSRVLWAAGLAAVLGLSLAGLSTWQTWGIASQQRSKAADRFDEARRVAADPTSAAVLLRQIPAPYRPDGWLTAANEALQSPTALRVLQHDGAQVQQLGYSSDGSHLLTLSDGTVRLVSVRDGAEVMPRRIEPGGADGGVLAAAFSPNGLKVITVARSGRVQAWPVGGGPPEELAGALDEDARLVAGFSPSGAQVIRAWGRRVQVTSVTGDTTAEATLPRPKRGPEDAPRAAVVADDGSRFAVGTDTGRIVLMGADFRRPPVLRHSGLRSLRLNAGGTHVLALGDGSLRIIDMVRGRGSTRTPSSVRVDTAVFSNDGEHIAVEYLDRDSGEHHVRAVAVSSRRQQEESPALSGRATALAAVSGGERLLRASGSAITTLHVGSGRATTEYRGHKGPIHRIQVSPDATTLATAGLDGTVRIWPLRHAAASLMAYPSATLASADPVVFSSGGTAVAGVLEDGELVSSTAVGAEILSLGAVDGAVEKLFIHDNAIRAVGVDTTGRLVVRDGTPEGSFSRVVDGPVLAVSPTLDAAVVRDGTSGLLRVPLDAVDAEPLPLAALERPVIRAAHDAAGRWIAIGDDRGHVVLADARTGAPLHEIDSGLELTTLCVSADGQHVAVGGESGALTVWSVHTTSARTLTLTGPIPRACSFGADDASLVVQSAAEAEVWALSGPEPRRLLIADARRPAGGATAWTDPENSALVALDDRARARTWLLDPDDLHDRLWQSTPTCALTQEEPIDLTRWCACQACLGATPAECQAVLESDALANDLDRVQSWCPSDGAPAL